MADTLPSFIPKIETPSRVRTFRLIRKEDVSGVSGLGLVTVGAQFPSGTVVSEWLPGRVDVRSLNVYRNIGELQLVNGHEGRTVVAWDDDEEAFSGPQVHLPSDPGRQPHLRWSASTMAGGEERLELTHIPGACANCDALR